jgi:ABC-type branched-subunit amino acid transport system substrate-binding protein
MAGCTGATGGGGGGGGGIDTVKVGVITSLSGPFAVFGQGELDGARLAKQDLEEELGVTVEIETGDSETNPDVGLERMKRLVTRDEVDVTLGGVSSAMGLKVGAWASDNGVPYVTMGASNAMSGSACAENMYAVYPSNTMLANGIGNKMSEVADSWYLFYSDYTWGQTAYQTVKGILEANGKTVVGADATPFPNDDFTSYLNAANDSEAEGLGLLVAGLDLRLATKQLLNKGMGDMKTAMHQLEDIVYWGLSKEAASVMDAGGQAWTPALDTGQEFKERVAAEAEASPFVRHYMGYTAMDQLVRAAVRAESTAAEDIRAEMEGHEVDSPVNDIKGGDLYWRECDHQLVQDVYLVEGADTGSMTDEPYRQWFDLLESQAGDDVVDSCEASNCSF